MHLMKLAIQIFFVVVVPTAAIAEFRDLRCLATRTAQSGEVLGQFMNRLVLTDDEYIWFKPSGDVFSQGIHNSVDNFIVGGAFPDRFYYQLTDTIGISDFGRILAKRMHPNMTDTEIEGMLKREVGSVNYFFKIVDIDKSVLDFTCIPAP